MDLHQLEIFCALIRLRSFSRAVEALYLTQPTVVRIKGMPIERSFSIILLKGRTRSPLCQTFLDVLTKKIK